MLDWVLPAAVFLAAAMALTRSDIGAPPQPAASAGAMLVKRDVLHETLQARATTVLYEQPLRPYWFPWYNNPAERASLSPNTKTRVVDVRETYIGLRRQVWLLLSTLDEPGIYGWHPLGNQHGAPGALRNAWKHVPTTNQERSAARPTGRRQSATPPKR